MEKPRQYKVLRDGDNDELLEALDDAMQSIADAMRSLSGYKVFSDWFDMLDDIFSEMEPEQEQYETVSMIEYAKEIEGLTRDYYRSVI